jgi:hypothetical protein
MQPTGRVGASLRSATACVSALSDVGLCAGRHDGPQLICKSLGTRQGLWWMEIRPQHGDTRLLAAMAIFIEYPVLAVAIGLVLLGPGRRAQRPAVDR